MAVLETRGLKKWFGGVLAVAGIDLTVEKNEIVGVIGPNGAGKTTLFNLITGYYPCDEGRVMFKGRDITGRPPERIVSLGLGRSFQVTSLFPELTVWENVQATVLFTKGKGLSLFSSAAGQASEETERILSQVELIEKSAELSGTLAAGDRKRLELGIVLATGADFLLLDEPTCGMSPLETSATVNLIRKIAGSMSLTVLFTEHKMDMVFEISSSIAVMNLGSIIASGKPEEIRSNKGVQDIYFGE
ncbi:MAG: ABC transporter ATP-binding protein [Desulfomonile sp.]|jgi:branched-chain amino acid transport system ATP-binding protein|nr:ABC transporter ATP-binding protein [Deltaproteobacteria bacterium]